MKLTEKELNEFPIGTKIYNGSGRKYMKLDNTSTQWREMKDSYWVCNEIVLGFKSIQKVEIPTYTEYIPPKPILDDKEKEYLSYVIRPFREKIKTIHKSCFEKEEYIYICCEIISDNFGLPFFKQGTMYKGMELDKEYSLEDLRLMRCENEK